MRTASADQHKRADAARLLLVVAVILGVHSIVAPAPASKPAAVYLIQGLSGKVVDIDIDGRSVATRMKAASAIGPIAVASGSRVLTARSGDMVLLQRRLTVRSGSSFDVVIHQQATPDAAPTATVFGNQSKPVPLGKALLTLTHAATVEPADIKVNGKVLLANVANGESLDLIVPAATYSVQLVPTGADGPPILGPVSLRVRDGALTRVYAVGGRGAHALRLVVLVMSVPHVPVPKPNRVRTGTGGQITLVDLARR